MNNPHIHTLKKLADTPRLPSEPYFKIPRYMVFGDKTIAIVKDSHNRKLQSAKDITSLTIYIIPTERTNTGDFADYEGKVCWASCPHTKRNNGSCYVAAYSPLQVARAFWNRHENGTDTKETINVTACYHVRATAHGDIGALNAEGKLKILELILNSARHVAYTAAWREPNMQMFRRFAQASVLTPTERKEANDLGWNTYRADSAEHPREKGEIQCLVKGTGHPAEQGKGCFSGCKTPCNGARNIVSPNMERIQAIYDLWTYNQSLIAH